MATPEYNHSEHKPASDPAEDSWDDDAYRRRQEHGRERPALSDEVRDRRAHLDRVL